MRFILKYSFIWSAVIFLLIKHGLTQPPPAPAPADLVNIAPFRKCYDDPVGSFYQFEAMDLHEQETIPLSRYKGKVLLVAKYGHDYLEILAFPCSQFRLQEPGANGTEIMNCVRWVRPGNNFNPGFQFFHKIQVNGENEHPLYTFLKSSCPPTRDGYRTPVTDLYYRPVRVSDVRWNFEKFLVDHRGKPIYRFDATTEPSDIEHFIVEAMGKARAATGPEFGHPIRHGDTARYRNSRRRTRSYV
ncbi:hypothetical protein M8J76_012620 [Diaphorina citri]|nr:hypothetical protein M8J76_012620 [Diaphorina citri]